jgi:hypothetical protein
MPWLWLTSVGSRSQLTGRPPRQFGAVYVVDDDDPTYAGDPYDDLNFTKGRTSPTYGECPNESCPYWHRVVGAGYTGDMLWTGTAATQSDYWVKYTPPQPGHFDVQVYVPSIYATTWGASYCLISSYWFQATRCGVLVDQNGTSDRWLSLGAYDFGAWPNAPYLGAWISDKTGEDYGQTYRNQLGIDAVRFRAPPPVFVPIVGRV